MPAPGSWPAEHAEATVSAMNAAEHEHVAVGEVDQLEDAVDHRVPERDQGVEGADREPDQEDPEEQVPSPGPG